MRVRLSPGEPPLAVEFVRDGVELGFLEVELTEGKLWQEGTDRVTLRLRRLRNDFDVAVDMPTGTMLE